MFIDTFTIIKSNDIVTVIKLKTRIYLALEIETDLITILNFHAF